MVLAALSNISSIIYFLLGLYTLQQERKSTINRLFFLFCLSMSVWSFGMAYIYLFPNIAPTYRLFWTEFAAFGWCTYAANLLYLVLHFTNNRVLSNRTSHRIAVVLIYLPAFILLSFELIIKWTNTRNNVFNFFITFDYIYDCVFVVLSLWLLIRKSLINKSRRFGGQVRVVIACLSIPAVIFIVFEIASVIQPQIASFNVLQIYSVISAVGIYYGMYKYGLFNLPLNRLSEEILSEMMDIVFFIDIDGSIIKNNRQAELLLGYDAGELSNMNIKDINLGGEFKEIFTKKLYTNEIIKFQEIELTKKTGDILPVCMTISYSVDPRLHNVTGIMLIGHDISITKQLQIEIERHQRAQERITYLAYHDSLTGLPNRKFLYDRLGKEIEKAKKSDSIFAVFFLDLDNFKPINDAYGHEAGDYLLCEFGEIVSRILRKNDIVSRVGGDEFILLVTDIVQSDDVDIVAQKLRQALNTHIEWDGNQISINASLGCAVYPTDGENIRQLIGKADEKMYIQKKESKLEI